MRFQISFYLFIYMLPREVLPLQICVCLLASKAGDIGGRRYLKFFPCRHVTSPTHHYPKSPPYQKITQIALPPCFSSSNSNCPFLLNHSIDGCAA